MSGCGICNTHKGCKCPSPLLDEFLNSLPTMPTHMESTKMPTKTNTNPPEWATPQWRAEMLVRLSAVPVEIAPGSVSPLHYVAILEALERVDMAIATLELILEEVHDGE